jgi:glutathione S-transferase
MRTAVLCRPVLHPLIGALIFNRQTTTGEITQASTRFEGLLGETNGRLAATGWLAGDSLSAADLNLSTRSCEPS